MIQKTLALKNLIPAFDALTIISMEKLPRQTAYHVAENLEEIQKHVDRYNKHRNEIIQRHGSPVGGGQFNFTPEQKDAANKEIDELAETEVTISITSLKLSALPPEVSANNLRSVKVLFEDDLKQPEPPAEKAEAPEE